MNIFTSLVLSTQKQAARAIHNAGGVLSRPIYSLKVTVLEQIDTYRFEVFHVTYPDKSDGKGWGEPHIAEQAHFSKEYSEQELTAFLELRGFDIENWQPVENDNA